ncbi:MAG: tetratricopeptide repeat protein [Flavobacteriales bacterium]|jgi:tetratricopeptide (TPR) repeat protein|nr:tetratricopeptide repeat protein [Flavobacteriales bacterium]MDG2174258.1 tetratricopeptide repeat protein [Flavobacteriaceae bacterium]
MKKIIFAINIIWMVSPSILSAQINVENIFSQANELYNKGSYIEAINNYKEIIKNDFHSAELYYNLGNAYYRLDSIASSVYYYEKALQLNPNDREIIDNLELINKTLVDEIDPITIPLIESILNRVSNIFYFETWGYISIFFSFLIVALFLSYYFANSSRVKRLTFVLLCISSIFMLVSLINGNKGYNNYINNEYAVIYSYETDLKTEPNYRSETLFMLHEGTKIQVLENYNNWIKIRLVNGQVGYIQLIDVKIL